MAEEEKTEVENTEVENTEEEKSEEIAEEKTEEIPEENNTAPDRIPPADADRNDTRLVNITPTYLVAAATVVVLVAAILLIVLLLPANRLKRRVSAGNKAYAAAKYDRAIAEYDKALSMDEYSFKARNGLILSTAAAGYGELRDSEAHEAVYSVAGCGRKLSEQDKLDAMELVLTAYEYLTDYIENGELIWLRLNTIYEKLGEPGELNPLMSEYAFNRGKAIIYEEGDPFLALEMFQSASAFSDGSEPVAEEMKTAVGRIIESYIRTDNFAEARNVLNTWGHQYDIDFQDSFAKEIDYKEDLYETKVSFLTRVYETMAPCFNDLSKDFGEDLASKTEGLDIRMFNYDWFEMQNLDGSEAADKLALASVVHPPVSHEPVIYSPEGFTGSGEEVACGLYSYGDLITNDDGTYTTSYYFFIGNYKDGKREGYGISFIRTGETSFNCFEGYWHDDAPNGFGVLYRKDNYAHTQLPEYSDIVFGNYNNGYQDGTMLVRIALNEHPGTYYEGNYEVRSGFGVEVPLKTDDYEIINNIPEDYCVIGVIPNITDGYSNYMIYRERRSARKTAIGY